MTPRFSIVSAVYDVARYLDDFIASVEAQEYDDLEVIMVDDGSTDGSAGRLDEWQRRRPELVTVLHRPNGGQASARNLGLEHARGEWVTFTDPDDLIEPNVLTAVAGFVDEHPDVELVALNRVLLDDASGQRRDHPLAVHFAGPDALRDLDDSPIWFYGSAPCAFFRRASLGELRFDETIRPVFEDGHFCDTYLLRASAPLVGFLSSATYVYRKRADGSSTINTARADVGRYTTVFERGYLDLVEQAERRYGRVPAWLQTHLLYELSWLLPGNDEPVVREAADAVHRLLAALAARFDPEVVTGFALRRFDPAWREHLLHGYRDEPWHTPYAVVDRVDPTTKRMRVAHRYTGSPPEVGYYQHGRAVVRLEVETRELPVLARALVHEHAAWLPYASLVVHLDGAPVPLHTAEPDPPRYRLEWWRARDALAAPARPSLRTVPGRVRRRLRGLRRP